MIDIKNGNIFINTIKIYRGMTMEEFISKHSDIIDKIVDKREKYKAYRLYKQSYNNYTLGIVAEFKNSIIKNVNISPLLGDERNFWDNWSEERELRRLMIYENFIEKEIGKRLENGILKHEWGNIYAFYDSKSAMVLAGVNYKYD